MTDDPYKVLGVPRTATQNEIRKAYRKRAKELHPDLNPGDQQVETQFKELSAAYRLLNDPEQRARFDRGEVDASGGGAARPALLQTLCRCRSGGPVHIDGRIA